MDILEDYREWHADQEYRIGTHGDRCHLWPRHERCMIHRLAEALESARADEPRWIPVGERLPDHGGTVVCRTADRQLQFGRVMTVSKYVSGVFARSYHWVGYPDGTLDVTHWVELPSDKVE